MRWPNWWAKPDCDAMPSESHTMNFIKLFFAALCTAWLLAACAVSDGLPKPQALPALTAGDTRWFKLEAQDEAGNIEQASLLALTEEMPDNTSAGLLVWENAWAERFAQAVRGSKGEVFLNGRIPNAVVEEALAVLATA